MAKRALIVTGGPEFHQPQEIGALLAWLLGREGFEVEQYGSWDVFDDKEKIAGLDLIVPNYTGGTITASQLDNFLAAVEGGTGVAGLHGGMGDALPGEQRYQLMVGGVFTAHPGNRFTVIFTDKNHYITRGLPDFTIETEHYYMLIDPSIHVLATSYYGVHQPQVWRPTFMPVIWVKGYGRGRVYYNALGHTADIVKLPEVLTLMQRGMLWAAR
ncbi:ThuA domain-containing protein [Paenibacillus sp. N4]|uniref:ThuA domain-containing protein n=1 Tax=Paenibacillus vietnamensis TaxID=2590547 RepID=UPI001CD0C8A6|nr:ThuA domain-containing protein [Paenibacillus vietnamensis]MCA0756278.1 ThuA domain-containing protein [Paenibacillus vietnamensis]